MLPWSADLHGRLDTGVIDSTALRGNPLGDPAQRPIQVYLPPGYDDSDARYPTVYVIQGYTGHLAMWANRTPFRQPFPETADAVFADGSVPGCIVVFVDAWTAYGGSQFVDSVGTGRYHSYLCDDVVAWVDARYRTIPDPASRAISGKSSGGFGAMITPMLRPDLFGHLATHAGDSLYELSYLPAFGAAARALRGYDGDVRAWWADFGSRTAFTKPEDGLLLNLYGCSAAFSPADDGTPQLPFDARSGRPIDALWQRWLDWDPVRMLDIHADAVRGLLSVWIDAGTSDEYFLDLGAEAFRTGLATLGVPDERVHFELFDAGHAAIDYRYPIALRWLAGRLVR